MRQTHVLQQKSDQLFAACLHFLLDRDEHWLTEIHDLSKDLLDAGYETSFEHKRKALIVKSIYARLAAEQSEEFLDRLNPRTSDLEVLNGTR